MSAPTQLPQNPRLIANAIALAYDSPTNVDAKIAAALVPYSTTVQMGVAIAAALGPYATTAAVAATLASALTAYSTTTAMNTAISTALGPYATTTAMNTAISTALASYPSTAAMNTAISTAGTNIANGVNPLLPTAVIVLTLSQGSGGTVSAGYAQRVSTALPGTFASTTLTAASTGSPSAGQIGVTRLGTGSWHVDVHSSESGLWWPDRSAWSMSCNTASSNQVIYSFGTNTGTQAYFQFMSSFGTLVDLVDPAYIYLWRHRTSSNT